MGVKAQLRHVAVAVESIDTALPWSLLDNRHLWLRSQSMVDALKVRATAFGAFRGFWDSQEIAEISL